MPPPPIRMKFRTSLKVDFWGPASLAALFRFRITLESRIIARSNLENLEKKFSWKIPLPDDHVTAPRMNF